MPKERVFVFIDGGNFYRQLIDLLGHSKLGDYSEFLEGLMTPNRELVEVIYYIGKINPNTGKTLEEKATSKRLFDQQEKFLGWLKGCGIQYRLGYFQTDGVTEKGVDVKIAVDMIRYAYEDKYDTAFLISGDGDLMDAVELVKFLGKKVFNLIFFKNKRFSYRLRKTCGDFFYIDRQVADFVKSSTLRGCLKGKLTDFEREPDRVV